ncbi:MAG: VOC family protein [Burkholderiales bacterium]|nr:VOC family protein [Burkholderiales bacterium]
MPAFPFRLVALDHLVLRVADMARMEAFYVGVLGCTVERRLASIGLLQLRAGASLIDMVPASGDAGKGRNLDHYCLRVDPFDGDAIRAHLRAAGVDAGATEQRYGAEGDGPSIYFDDPEGNTIEFKGPPAV